MKWLHGAAVLSCTTGLVLSAAVGAHDSALLCALLGGVNWWYYRQAS